MTMGPLPIRRIFLISVRFGILKTDPRGELKLDLILGARFVVGAHGFADVGLVALDEREAPGETSDGHRRAADHTEVAKDDSIRIVPRHEFAEDKSHSDEDEAG